jgi:hypothetical protein
MNKAKPFGNLWPDDGSRMSREVHVRFCERAGLRCPARLTQIQSAPAARPRITRLSPAELPIVLRKPSGSDQTTKWGARQS